MLKKIAAISTAAFFLCLPAFAENVRVLVGENMKTATVSVKGEYIIRALPSLKIVKKGKDLRSVPVAPTDAGMRFGKDVYPCRGFRLETNAERGLFLNKTRFRGSLDILKNNSGLLYAINTLNVEKYLYGVLHYEVSPWWPMESLKAQAVAARTYALYQAQVSKPLEYDLKSSTSSQVYGGSTTERFRSRFAVDATKGQVMTYEEKIFPGYFHSVCGGTTAASNELWKIELPPLSGKIKCPYCRMSTHYQWQTKVPLPEIEHVMKRNNRFVGSIIGIEPVSQTPSGRVGSLKITGVSGEMTVAAKDFRIWVGGDRLRSTAFTLVLNEDMAEFKGKGWGHGVGLCQWGAFGQSLLGRKYDEILKFYYPESEIKIR